MEIVKSPWIRPLDMDSMKAYLKQYQGVRNAYENYKAKKSDFCRRKNLNGQYTFVDRSKGKKQCCIILAGFKEYLYDATMPRLKRFVPGDVDVCLLSAGRYSPVLNELAIQNDWSYLYTKEKNVSLVQNIAINVHKSAEFVYKIDEDIFLTENFFRTVEDCYSHCQENTEFNVGFCAPLIPINGYGHTRILSILGLTEQFTKLFESPKVGVGRIKMIESSADCAKFMWDINGDGTFNIDDLDKMLNDAPFRFGICPTRFSIGAIYFSRELWEHMDFFEVKNRNKPRLGDDEKQLCLFCYQNSRAMVISENTAVGHLSFGQQNEAMREFFAQHQGLFCLSE